MIAIRTRFFITLIFSLLLLTACADWQTTPTEVDKNHGLAVRQMIQSQTLYPEHGQEHRQVLLLDGRKAQGIITPYRALGEDLRQGKESIETEID